MDSLKTHNQDIVLVAPDVERDAPISVQWLEGAIGRDTLKLMGNTDENNKPSTLEAEKERVRDFIASKDQLNWMIQFKDKIVGSVWVSLKPTDYLLAPSIHIMIGDPAARGQGVGSQACSAVIDHMRKEGSYDYLYSRHLVKNTPANNLLKDLGFENLGEQYSDSDGLSWQNVSLGLNNSLGIN